MTVYRRAFILGLGALMPLAACNGEEAFAFKAETPAERELRESRERLQRTVGEGAAAGVAAGALVGALVGGTAGAFRGAQLGRLGGAAAGGYVRQLQEEFASQEQILGQVLKDLQATNARLERAIAAVRAVIAEQQAQASADPVRRERNASEAAAAVQAAVQQAQFFGSARSLLTEQGFATGPSGVDAELARLQSRITAMRGIAEGLAGS